MLLTILGIFHLLGFLRRLVWIRTLFRGIWWYDVILELFGDAELLLLTGDVLLLGGCNVGCHILLRLLGLLCVLELLADMVDPLLLRQRGVRLYVVNVGIGIGF